MKRIRRTITIDNDDDLFIRTVTDAKGSQVFGDNFSEGCRWAIKTARILKVTP